MSTITVCRKSYEIIDALENITLADSFVRNKIGTGNGEAKLYVGNESSDLLTFFDTFDCHCFFLKKDFRLFLQDARDEYLHPQQDYKNKSKMPGRWNANVSELLSYNDEMLKFDTYRVPVNPPRVYINSDSAYYYFMRKVGLPNISYLSILKLKDEIGSIVYYFRIFIDYRDDLVPFESPEETKVVKEIESSDLPVIEKEVLTRARVGQGLYREKLLEECPFCPFTLVNDERLLVASHIKPWCRSNNSEKIDPKNGFAFTPTFDALFDKGFITFNDDKTLVVSPWLSPMNQKRLGIYTGKLIEKLPLDAQRMIYLAYHREFIFKH